MKQKLISIIICLFVIIFSLTIVQTFAETNLNLNFIEYPCSYDRIDYFKNGYAIAVKDNTYFIIDYNNGDVIFETNNPFLKLGVNYYIYTDSTGIIVCDMSGNVISRISNHIGVDISDEGYILAYDYNAKYQGAFDIEGNEVLGFKYDKIVIRDDIAIALKNNTWELFNLSNKKNLYSSKGKLEFLNNDYILIESNNKYGIINIKGETIIKVSYDDILYHNNSYILEDGAQTIVLDNEFKEVSTFEGYFISYSDNYLVYTDSSSVCIINSLGNITYQKSIDEIRKVYGFSDGIGIEEYVDGQQRYINCYGEILCDNSSYDILYPFSNGYAVVGKIEYDEVNKSNILNYAVIDKSFSEIFNTDKVLCFDSDKEKISLNDGYIITYDDSISKYGFIKIIKTSSITSENEGVKEGEYDSLLEDFYNKYDDSSIEIPNPETLDQGNSSTDSNVKKYENQSVTTSNEPLILSNTPNNLDKINSFQWTVVFCLIVSGVVVVTIYCILIKKKQ